MILYRRQTAYRLDDRYSFPRSLLWGISSLSPRARAASARPPTTAPSPSPPIGVCRGQRWRAHATRAQWRRRSFPRGERLILPASKHWVNISHSESLSFDTFYFVFWIGTLAQGDFLRIFSFFSFFFIAIFLLSLIEFCRNWSIRGTSWGLLTRFFVIYCATMGCK